MLFDRIPILFLTSFSGGSNPGWKVWASGGCHGFFRGNLPHLNGQ